MDDTERMCGSTYICPVFVTEYAWCVLSVCMCGVAVCGCVCWCGGMGAGLDRNFERFELMEMEVEPGHIKEVLRSIVHTLLFNRALGSLQPVEASSALFQQITYAKIDDPLIDNHVDRDIDKFIMSIHKNRSEKANYYVSFYEKQAKKGMWPFSAKEEKLVWEIWNIPLHIKHAPLQLNNTQQPPQQPPPPASAHPSPSSPAEISSVQRAEHALLANMHRMVEQLNNKTQHIPPIKQSGAALTFNFECSYSCGGQPDDNWGLSTLKRMIKQGPPMLLS